MGVKRTIGLLAILLALQKPVVSVEVKPKYEPLTTKQFVEILDKYSVNEASLPPVGYWDGGWYLLKGVTDYNAKSITINRILTKEEKYITILHEFRHAWWEKEGLPQNEDWVVEYSCKDYKELFKKECPKGSSWEEMIKWEYR